MLGMARWTVGRSLGTRFVTFAACALVTSLSPAIATAADTPIMGKPVPKPASVSAAATPSPASAASASTSPSTTASPTGVDQRVLRSDGANVLLHVFRPTTACNGLAVLSPGAGDDRDALAWLGRALSQYGWLTITMAHKEDNSRDSLRDRVRSGGMRDGSLALPMEPEVYDDRLEDTGAALHWGRTQCRTGPAVFMGHAAGAATVMFEAGAKNKLGLDSDDRFDGYVVLSPQGPGPIFPAGAWHDIRKPMLLVTGTRDAPLDGKWQERTTPYADLPPGCHWLAVVDGATHYNFAGFGYGHPDIEAKVLPLIERFLDNLRAHRCAVPMPAPGVKLDTK